MPKSTALQQNEQQRWTSSWNSLMAMMAGAELAGVLVADVVEVEWMGRDDGSGVESSEGLSWVMGGGLDGVWERPSCNCA